MRRPQAWAPTPAFVLSLIALVMATAGTGYTAFGDGRPSAAAAGNARGEPVQIGVRNRSRAETGLVAASDGYALRLSNTREGGGGGAVYGCRAPDAPAADDLACLYADNLRGGKAFLFRSQDGPTVGHFDLGNPAGPPFTTNATGLVANLNADKVDGLDASQLQGQTGPQGPAGPAGPAGPKGDLGPTIGEWGGGFCVETNATFVDCAEETVEFPGPGVALLVGTATWSAAAAATGNCRLRADNTTVGFQVSFGQDTATFLGGAFPAAKGTIALTGVTQELASGPHDFTLQCQETEGEPVIDTAQLSVVVLAGDGT